MGKVEVIIFDFDGVILESSDIKTEAFRDMFSCYPDKVDEIVQHHVDNGGISRFVKFRYIYGNILGESLSKEAEAALGQRFSGIVLEKVMKAPFVAGVREFLRGQRNAYRFFIASGTPQTELDHIVSAREITGYFEEIHGSPRKKTEIVEDIIARHGFDRGTICFIGDAESDRLAAAATKVRYIDRRDIGDLTGLQDIIKRRD